MRVKRHLLAAAVGAAIAWFRDPRQGPRRRMKARATIERGVAVVRRQDAATTEPSADAAGSPPNPPTLTDVLAAAKRTGYHADFMADGERLVCSACNTTSGPGDMAREWVHRLEGMSDPDELLTISALECPACGTKGLLVMPYGPAANEDEATISRLLQTPRDADMAPLDKLGVAV